MSDTDYKGICDTVRAKTGTTALLKSAEVAPAIRSIELSTTSLTLTVTTEAGAIVTATKGSLSVSAVATNGTAVLKLKEAGEWTVTASLNGETSTVVVSVSDRYEISLSYAVEVNYTGTYTDETVQMTDGTYRLLTLSGSGTLTFNQPTECDIWLCGGGGGGCAGTYALGRTWAGAGGGGGYVENLTPVTIANELIVTIGAGGSADINGANTSCTSSNVNASAAGGNTGTNTINGGTGGSGGGAGSSSGSGNGGIGAGETTRPFGEFFLLPYCAGGAGAPAGSYKGGDGGSNGSNATRSTNTSAANGGYYGGGNGADKDNNNAAAGNGFAWGAGGGGGQGSSGVVHPGGSGYQGCVMVRIKLNDEGIPRISFTIGSGTYQAFDGMTWAEWVESTFNTTDLVIKGDNIGVNGSSVKVQFAGVNVLSSDVIVANRVYTRVYS
jgi:hypothetical protein